MSVKDRSESLSEFSSARRRAGMSELSARLTGRDTRLLPFEEIRRELRRQNPTYTGIHEIPLDAIVGSVGRYREFNRSFLPLSDSIKERWVGIDSLAKTIGWPPISVYKIGDAYFVRDGNHRVSVARQMDLPTIEAEVWEFPEDVTIDPDDSLDDVLIRFGEKMFMETTGLNERYPDHEITFTTPGRYTELLAQIEQQIDILTYVDGEAPTYEEAVDAWYEMVYMPAIQIIHESTLLDTFPGRTESDLFVWLSKYRDHVDDALIEHKSLVEVANMLAGEFREGPVKRAARSVRRLLGSDEPADIETLLEDSTEEE